MPVLLPCVTEESYRSGKSFWTPLKLYSIPITVKIFAGRFFLERDSKGPAASGAHKQMQIMLLFSVNRTESHLTQSSSSELARTVHVHMHVQIAAKCR